jgi:PIN domain nuclease of toxin-antitoxin system
MRILPDTHILMWVAIDSAKLPGAARQMLIDQNNQIYFTALTIWEIAIKTALGKKGFDTDAATFRRALVANGYIELPITSEHAIAVSALPPLHKDPFDRILIAQATVEGITLITSDRQLAKYPGPIRKV